MYKFKDVHSLGKPFYYVHPYKQLAVKHLVDNAYDWIEGIIVFGSAVSHAHHYDSDLDVCIIGVPTGEFCSRNLRIREESYDFILVESVDMLRQLSNNDNFSVYHDIMTEGVLVYDKRSYSLR